VTPDSTPRADADLAAPHGTRPGRSLRTWQVVTILLLFSGYAACYFCRADLAVSTPLLLAELGKHGISHDDALNRIGTISTLGVIAYAVGKLLLTGLGDFWGGKPNFLIGMGGALLFTVLFALGGGVPVFTLAWIGNRLTQSIAWAGLIKVSSKWFDYSWYGTVIGILSISYLIGDAAARETMGMLIARGFGWRSLFVYAAIVVGITFVASLWWLSESRTRSGFAEARANPMNLYAKSEGPAVSIAALLAPLLRSPAFLLVCFLSLGCTIVRETFNSWTPTYLKEHIGFAVGDAAQLSAIFPGVGAISVLLTGWLSDRLGLNGRALIMFVGLMASAAALIGLSMYTGTTPAVLPLVAIGTVAFCLLGPYSYLGGAFALDFGGKQAGAVSSGLIDGVGYVGGSLAGYGVSAMSTRYGWNSVFVALALISAVAALSAGWLLAMNMRAARTAVARA